MIKYIITFLLGLVIGGALCIFLLGVPRASSSPGTRVQAPPASGSPPTTVVISVGDGFLTEMLGTVFRELDAPAFKLSSNRSQPEGGPFERAAFQFGCDNTVTLSPEGGDVKSRVEFVGGKITAPVVFSGSYGILGNCMQFKGWAQTSIELSFDQAAQALYGRVNVEGVNLEGVPPVANSFVTVFVRNAIDARINPLELLRRSQLELMIPVKGSNGAVKANVTDVRSEVQEGVLKLHITYDFSGAKGQPPG